jgi:hypothetical protein
LAALLGSATALARRALGWVAARAVDRSLSPGSLSGISVLLAVCAAAWFSGGTDKDGARGLLAMLGWLLALGASRGLAAFMARRVSRDSAGADRPADGGTDWLVLPAVTAADQVPARVEQGVPAETWTGPLGFGWLTAVCAGAAECAIYGGMAAGIARPGAEEPWALAIAAIAAVAVVDMLAACRATAMSAERARKLAANPILRAVGSLMRVPPAVRGALAFAGFALGGPLAALFAVLGIEAIAILAVLATLVLVIPSARSGRAARSRSGPATVPAPTASARRAEAGGHREATTITAIVEVAWSGGETAAVRFTTTPSAAWLAAGRPRAPRQATTRILTGSRRASRPASRSGSGSDSGSDSGSGAGAAARDTGVTARHQPLVTEATTTLATSAPDPPMTSSEVILALRDDGSAARWAGRIVQGNLIPLPPALAGLVATAMLAALGLRHLPGFIAMTPPVVMMLAAPGSSHPHDRRFDWLVPALLATAQYVYLGSLGLALAVPGPVVFSACAVLVIWYASRIVMVTAGQTPAAASAWHQAEAAEPGHDEGKEPEDQPGPWVSWGAGLGWESRMFAVGLAATFGLATFGYVGLAAYLGVLTCRMVVTGYLVPREEDRQ